MRERIVVLQSHTHQFLGTFGGPGNGDYRGELLRAIQILIGYAKQVEIPPGSILIRLDGLYGNAAPLFDVLTSGLGLIARRITSCWILLKCKRSSLVLLARPVPILKARPYAPSLIARTSRSRLRDRWCA